MKKFVYLCARKKLSISSERLFQPRRGLNFERKKRREIAKEILRARVYACKIARGREKEVGMSCRWKTFVDESTDPRFRSFVRAFLLRRSFRTMVDVRWNVPLNFQKVSRWINARNTDVFSVIYIRNRKKTYMYTYTYANAKVTCIHWYTYTIINVWNVGICLNKYLKHLKRKASLVLWLKFLLRAIFPCCFRFMSHVTRILLVFIYVFVPRYHDSTCYMIWATISAIFFSSILSFIYFRFFGFSLSIYIILCRFCALIVDIRRSIEILPSHRAWPRRILCSWSE